MRHVDAGRHATCMHWRTCLEVFVSCLHVDGYVQRLQDGNQLPACRMYIPWYIPHLLADYDACFICQAAAMAQQPAGWGSEKLVREARREVCAWHVI